MYGNIAFYWYLRSDSPEVGTSLEVEVLYFLKMSWLLCLYIMNIFLQSVACLVLVGDSYWYIPSYILELNSDIPLELIQTSPLVQHVNCFIFRDKITISTEHYFSP